MSSRPRLAPLPLPDTPAAHSETKLAETGLTTVEWCILEALEAADSCRLTDLTRAVRAGAPGQHEIASIVRDLLRRGLVDRLGSAYAVSGKGAVLVTSLNPSGGATKQPPANPSDLSKGP